MGGCDDVPEGVPLAKRLFVVDQTTAAEDQVQVLPQTLRRKRKRWGPPPIYIDGKFRGFMRYPELHPGLEAIWEKEALPEGLERDHHYVRRFAWADLFALYGVDLSKIKAVHFYGGRNAVSVVEGDEFRRVGRNFRFSFNNNDGGTIRQRPPREGVKINTSVDIVNGVAVYAEREPPRYDNEILTLPDGTKLGSKDERGQLVFPYSDGERHGGSRVYLDGNYVDAFRRRAMTADMLSDPKDTGSPYLLGKALESMKIDLRRCRRIQIWGDRDELLADWSGEALARLDERTFALPQHSRGRIVLTDSPEKTVMSMMIYADLTPANREPPPEVAATFDDDD